MAEECVIAIYNTIDRAKEAVLALKESGFPRDQMSLATKTLKLEEEVREAIEFGDEMAKDAAIGAGAGTLLATFAEATAVAVTGMGAFLVAGPLVMGALVGGLIGAASGWGVHRDHLPAYEKKLHEGKVLLIAHGDPVKVALADQILQGTDPLELRLHAESSADAPEIERT